MSLTQQDWNVFVAMFNEFGVWFTLLNAVAFAALYFVYRPKLTPSKNYSFTKTLIGFVAVNFAYLFTIAISDRVYKARPVEEQVPMYDLGFALVPYRQELQLFCDFFASGPILLICVFLVIGVRDMKNLTAGELGPNTLPLVETNNAPMQSVQEFKISQSGNS